MGPAEPPAQEYREPAGLLRIEWMYGGRRTRARKKEQQT